MWAGLITLFPEVFEPLASAGVTRRALASGALRWEFFNPRDYSQRSHAQVDDRPYGGGPGMVLQAEPLLAALAAARSAAPSAPRVLLTSPQGQRFDHAMSRSLAAEPALVVLCGRYEGIDERVLEAVDEEVSIGDYVLTGGELPALVMLDALCRWLPGTLGNSASAGSDSFVDGLLEGPQYTRPDVLPGGSAVPAVLLAGDHAAVARWRRQQALRRTLERRPDLLFDYGFSEADLALLCECFEQKDA